MKDRGVRNWHQSSVATSKYISKYVSQQLSCNAFKKTEFSLNLYLRHYFHARKCALPLTDGLAPWGPRRAIQGPFGGVVSQAPCSDVASAPNFPSSD